MAPPEGPQAFEVTSKLFVAKATIDLEDANARILDALRWVMTNPSFSNLSGPELADAFDAATADMSDAPIERAAQEAINKADSLGRNQAAQRNAPFIARVVRSEILDQNTCDPCIGLDGTVYEMNSPEYWENFPPAKCDGRELGRCLYIYEAA